MIPIYLCDDNTVELEHVRQLIANLLLIENYDMQIVLATSSPEQVIAHRQAHRQRSVYFLDVDLRHAQYNGFMLAQEIRRLDPRGFLIFVTTHDEMIFETFNYRLEVMSYIAKDNPQTMRTQIAAALRDISGRLLNQTNDAQGYYTVKAGPSVHYVPLKDIIYFETAATRHQIILHAENRLLEFRGDLKAIEAEVGQGFFKPHRSYLINLQKVKQVNYQNKTITLSDNSTCLLSRKGKATLQALLQESEPG